MFLDAYIGRLDDPKFVANRYEPSGSVPGAVGPLFPHGRHAFDELVARIEDGRLPGGPTQHIAYVAPASKSQIETFFREVCLTDPLLAPGTTSPHLRVQMLELQAFIAGLHDDGQ